MAAATSDPTPRARERYYPPPPLRDQADVIRLLRETVPEAAFVLTELRSPGGREPGSTPSAREIALESLIADLMEWARAAADVLEHGEAPVWREPEDKVPGELFEAAAEYAEALEGKEPAVDGAPDVLRWLLRGARQQRGDGDGDAA